MAGIPLGRKLVLGSVQRRVGISALPCSTFFLGSCSNLSQRIPLFLHLTWVLSLCLLLKEINVSVPSKVCGAQQGTRLVPIPSLSALKPRLKTARLPQDKLPLSALGITLHNKTGVSNRSTFWKTGCRNVLLFYHIVHPPKVGTDCVLNSNILVLVLREQG